MSEPKPMIEFADFAKVAPRAAKITQPEAHPNPDNPPPPQVDDASGPPRQICAGIKGHYNPADLVGKSIVIVANLAPRVIRGEESRGMLLAASDAPKDGGGERNVIVLTPMSEIAPGSMVS